MPSLTKSLASLLTLGLGLMVQTPLAQAQLLDETPYATNDSPDQPIQGGSWQVFNRWSDRNLINVAEGFWTEEGMTHYRCGYEHYDNEALQGLCPEQDGGGGSSGSSAFGPPPPPRKDDRHQDWEFPAVLPYAHPDAITAEVWYLVNGTMCSHDTAHRDFKLEMQMAVTGDYRQCDVYVGFVGDNVESLPDAEYENFRWIDSFRVEDWLEPQKGAPRWGKFTQDSYVVPQSKWSKQWRSEYCPLGENIYVLRVECPKFHRFPSGVMAFKRPRMQGPDWYPMDNGVGPN